MRGPSSARSPTVARTNSFGSQYSRSSMDYNNRMPSPSSPGPVAFPLTEAQNPIVHRQISDASRYSDGYGRQQGSYPTHGVAGVAPADLPVTTARGFGYQDNMYIEGNKETKKKCCCSCGSCTCSKSCWKTTAIWAAVTIAVILFLLFVAIWIIFPLVFMNTYSLQRFLIFMDIDQPENPEYSNYDKYNAVGVRNFYVEIDNSCCPMTGGNSCQCPSSEPLKKLKLGVWQVVPEEEIPRARKYNEVDYINSLKSSWKPIIIYFHGQSGTRIFFYTTYQVLRKEFHVLAFDYRGYADSTDAVITEKNVVQDSLKLYDWVLKNTNQENIYFWGHSLGTALSTHTLKEIYRSGNKLTKPKGLFLEAPFTRMWEEIYYNPLAKYWRWLVYFEQTFQDPVEENGFVFDTISNIKQIDCPVMVVHAEDDIMIPYHLGKKVFETAYHNRTNIHSNEKAIFHLVPAAVKSNHMEIFKDPQLPFYIKDFLEKFKPDSRGASKPARLQLDSS